MPDPAPPDGGEPAATGQGLVDPQSPRPPPPVNFPPGSFVDVNGGPQPRPNLGSMLFLTMFFFFMSGNNQMPAQTIVVGPDGEIQPRLTELELAGRLVDEYKGFVNGTGNWTEVSSSLPADTDCRLRTL